MFRDLSDVKRRCQRVDFGRNNKIHWFSSKFSIYFSYVFIKLGFSADQVTGVFFVTGLLGALFAQGGGWYFYIMTYVFWRMHIIIDMSDGDVARYHQSFSIRGKYWDSLIHAILNPLFSFSIISSQFVNGGSIWFLYTAILLAATNSLLLSVKYHYQAPLKEKSKDGKDKWKLDLGKSRLTMMFTEAVGMEGFVLLGVLLSILNYSNEILMLGIAYSFMNMGVAAIKFYQLSYKGKTMSQASND